MPMQYTPNPDRDSGRWRGLFRRRRKKNGVRYSAWKKPALARPNVILVYYLCKYKPETRQLALSALIGIRDDREILFFFSKSSMETGETFSRLESLDPPTPPGGGAAVSVLEAGTSLTTPPSFLGYFSLHGMNVRMEGTRWHGAHAFVRGMRGRECCLTLEDWKVECKSRTCKPCSRQVQVKKPRARR